MRFRATSYWGGVSLPLTVSPRSLHSAENGAGSSGPPWLFFLHGFSRSAPFVERTSVGFWPSIVVPERVTRWVACAPVLPSCVLGPLLVCPASHQTVSGIHETLCSRSASPCGRQQPVGSAPCNPYPMKTGERLHLFGPLV